MKDPRLHEHELRCEQCSRRPLLATYGVDEKGHPYVRVKIWRQNRIFGHTVVEGGVVRLQCRECMRWCRVIIRGRKATLVEESNPVPEAEAG